MKYRHNYGEKKSKKMDLTDYFIDNFYFKSTEGFINIINKGNLIL